MILKFPTESARTDFIDWLGKEQPDLMRHAKPSYSQPDVIVVRDADNTILGRFRKLSKSVAKTYDDVQFEPFGFG